MIQYEDPIDMVLHCPECGAQHIDKPEPSMLAGDAAMMGGDWPGRWTNPPHRTHLCHFCGHKWRPADVATNGVAAVKTRGKDDSPIATPAVRPRVPDWEAVKDKRMSELTPAQRDDAQELWVRANVGYLTESAEFLLRRLDEARGVK